jgi:hypothetical protein
MGVILLMEIPIELSSLQTIINALGEAISIHRPIQEAVHIGDLFSPRDQVVELPEVDVPLPIPAEAIIPVIVLHHAVDLLVSEQNGRDISLQIGRQMMVHPAATYELGKLLLCQALFT